MTYRVGLTYRPDVGTFRGKRGAWRVCWCLWLPPTPELPTDSDVAYLKPFVSIPAARKLRRGTWVNPLKILKEYQSTKRSNTQ